MHVKVTHTIEMNKITWIGIDPGNKMSGVVVVTNENGIREGYNLPNSGIFDFVVAESKLCVELRLILEDIRPYNMRITDEIINTIKFLGELEYRFMASGFKFELIPRWQVKYWVFVQYKVMVIPQIDKKIAAANARKAKNGVEVKNIQTATFVYVDDRMVANAMRDYWKIKNPTKVGQKAMYNLKDHSWQALGLVTYAMNSTSLKT